MRSRYAKAGASGEIYGIDISEGMLNATSRGLAKSGLLNRVELQCGNALNLLYSANFFDAVCISFALKLFDTPDIPIVLQQFRRVLKNGDLEMVLKYRIVTVVCTSHISEEI